LFVTRLDLVMKGGPLGYGCYKVIQVAVASLLWITVRGYLPPTIANTLSAMKNMKLSLQLSETSSWIVSLSVVVTISLLSLIVNAVLWIWSRKYPHKEGSHDGLNSMLQATMGHSLSATEHIQLALLALLNATCEEFTCRGFWRHELELTAHCTKVQSNIVQGIIFGLWHYFGIPSGWTGVALTTVYGWVMGYLSDWTVTDETSTTTGLLLPIITHSIADYYIFAVLARQNINSGENMKLENFHEVDK
jgi:membrane protease YdiL (CAAX protease family)